MRVVHGRTEKQQLRMQVQEEQAMSAQDLIRALLAELETKA